MVGELIRYLQQSRPSPRDYVLYLAPYFTLLSIISPLCYAEICIGLLEASFERIKYSPWPSRPTLALIVVWCPCQYSQISLPGIQNGRSQNVESVRTQEVRG